MAAGRMTIPGDLPGDNPPPARQAPPPPHVKPRTWSLPPEPGPEVTAVTCDCHARRWHRDGPLWQGSGWRGEVYRWPGLLANHPNLTDATETGADHAR